MDFSAIDSDNTATAHDSDDDVNAANDRLSTALTINPPVDAAMDDVSSYNRTVARSSPDPFDEIYAANGRFYTQEEIDGFRDKNYPTYGNCINCLASGPIGFPCKGNSHGEFYVFYIETSPDSNEWHIPDARFLSTICDKCHTPASVSRYIDWEFVMCKSFTYQRFVKQISTASKYGKFDSQSATTRFIAEVIEASEGMRMSVIPRDSPKPRWGPISFEYLARCQKEDEAREAYWDYLIKKEDKAREAHRNSLYYV